MSSKNRFVDKLSKLDNYMKRINKKEKQSKKNTTWKGLSTWKYSAESRAEKGEVRKNTIPYDDTERVT